MQPFKIGARVICNTIGHFTSGMIGNVASYCSNNNPDDRALGLCDGYIW